LFLWSLLQWIPESSCIDKQFVFLFIFIQINFNPHIITIKTGNQPAGRWYNHVFSNRPYQTETVVVYRPSPAGQVNIGFDGTTPQQHYMQPLDLNSYIINPAAQPAQPGGTTDMPPKYEMMIGQTATATNNTPPPLPPLPPQQQQTSTLNDVRLEINENDTKKNAN
jgi:hypothetical protein